MTASWAERIVEAGVLFLLVFTPLAFGTVQPWSEAIAELVILAMAVTYVLGTLVDWELRVQLPRGWLPAGLFLVLIGLQAVVPGWSLDAHATRGEALKLAAVAVCFVISYNTYRTRAQATRAIVTMVVVGAAISVFAIVQRVTWNGHLYWIGPDVPHAFGPFVNRAHFTGLMVIVAPLTLAYAFVTRRRSPVVRRRFIRSWSDRVRQWAAGKADRSRLILFLVVVMGGAALVSGSRGGLVAFSAALVAMSVAVVERGSRGAGVARLSLIVVLIVLAGGWIAGDVVFGTVERLADELGNPERSIRLAIWTDAARLWRSAPLLGTGFGTFEFAFPRFRTIQAPYVFSHAESDWVQLLTDSGVVGLVLTLTAVTTFALGLRSRYRRAESRWARALTLAGLVALGGAVVQSIGNFNLPIMSNFLYLAITVAIAARALDMPPALAVPDAAEHVGGGSMARAA